MRIDRKICRTFRITGVSCPDYIALLRRCIETFRASPRVPATPRAHKSAIPGVGGKSNEDLDVILGWWMGHSGDDLTRPVRRCNGRGINLCMRDRHFS